jgi:hypothetical protein
MSFGWNFLWANDEGPSPLRPVITVQPSDLFVTNEGDDWTAEITATSPDASPLTYQWQALPTDVGAAWIDMNDDATLSGSLTDTLFSATSIIAFTGYQLRCVVTNDSGFINSNPALLTIQNAADSLFSYVPHELDSNEDGVCNIWEEALLRDNLITPAGAVPVVDQGLNGNDYAQTDGITYFKPETSRRQDVPVTVHVVGKIVGDGYLFDGDAQANGRLYLKRVGPNWIFGKGTNQTIEITVAGDSNWHVFTMDSDRNECRVLVDGIQVGVINDTNGLDRFDFGSLFCSYIQTEVAATGSSIAEYAGYSPITVDKFDTIDFLMTKYGLA